MSTTKTPSVTVVPTQQVSEGAGFIVRRAFPVAGLSYFDPILLIDEMSLGLAPVLVDQLLEILQEIRAQGVSILMVEQDVQTALEFSERAYVLETGRITLQGPSAELLDDPQVKKAYLGV